MKPRTYEKGDYLLLDNFGGPLAWVEFDRLNCGWLHGRVRSYPLPLGLAHDEEVVFASEEVKVVEHLPAMEVNEKLLADFWRVPSANAEPPFSEAWEQDELRKCRPITLHQHRTLSRRLGTNDLSKPVRTYITAKTQKARPRCGMPFLARLVVIGLGCVAVIAVGLAIYWSFAR